MLLGAKAYKIAAHLTLQTNVMPDNDGVAPYLPPWVSTS